MKRLLLALVLVLSALPASAQTTGAGRLNFDHGLQGLKVAADFTTASGSLVNITGLSWILPANQVTSTAFECTLYVSQATAAVANSIGLQVVTTAPTNVMAGGFAATSATAIATLTATWATTTATNILTFTPSAVTTIWPVHVFGVIENASNTSDNIVNLMALTGNASDSLTVKRGSTCRVF